MIKRKWNPHTTVMVCGVEIGAVTENGKGTQMFEDLKAAQAVFPDLDPSENTARFTWALGDPEVDVMRFETWKAYSFYSS